ncbi:MAG: hypothetical protein PUD92_07805 [Clostridiales bacterium]|nr:hypothetical protein [Clostridiales bacterium]
MKKYSDPKMSITDFTDESVITASPVTPGSNTLETWQSTTGGTILESRNFQAMTELTKIVF